MAQTMGQKQDQHWQTTHCIYVWDYVPPKMSGECPTICSLEIKQVSSETETVAV